MKFLYIGGYKETCRSDASKSLNQFGVDCVPIDWSKSIGDNLKNIEILADDTIIISFSLGGIISLELSKIYPSKIKTLVLCSLSPYFSYVVSEIPKEVFNLLGEDMVEELSSISIKGFSQINIPVVFIQGENDNQATKDKIQVLYQNWRCNNKEIIEIKGAQHNIHEDIYLDCIKDIIRKHSV